MDLFPHIIEVPSAVIIERLFIFLVGSFLVWLAPLSTIKRLSVIALLFAGAYLSLYFTWITFFLDR